MENKARQDEAKKAYQEWSGRNEKIRKILPRGLLLSSAILVGSLVYSMSSVPKRTELVNQYFETKERISQLSKYDESINSLSSLHDYPYIAEKFDKSLDSLIEKANSQKPILENLNNELTNNITILENRDEVKDYFEKSKKKENLAMYGFFGGVGSLFLSVALYLSLGYFNDKKMGKKQEEIDRKYGVLK